MFLFFCVLNFGNDKISSFSVGYQSSFIVVQSYKSYEHACTVVIAGTEPLTALQSLFPWVIRGLSGNLLLPLPPPPLPTPFPPSCFWENLNIQYV